MQIRTYFDFAILIGELAKGILLLSPIPKFKNVIMTIEDSKKAIDISQ